MSFILDALKKSETERQRADAPALYEMKMAPPRHGVAVWLIVLAALLVINVVVLSVVLLRGTHGTPQTDAGPVATPPAAAPAPAPTPGPASPMPSATPSASVVAGPASPPPVPPAAAAPDSPPASTAGSDAADDAPAVEPARTSATANPKGEVPTYAQAASVPGANLPDLKLDLHAYASNPADRFVFLNMTKLREGQSTPAGVRVESITPDGAILSWQGSRFFLQRQ
jgi:general secretion pathway protein B